MSEDFSEHRCKRRYKSKNRKFPVVRVFLLCLFFFLFVKLGFAERIVNKLSLPDDAQEDVSSWESRCAEMHGKAFALENGLAQCSWILSDSLFSLPNPFLRYVASTAVTSRAKLHWIARQNDFSDALLVQLEDSSALTYLHIPGADSTFYWVRHSDGCRFPGVCPKQPLDWSAVPISENFDFEGRESLLAMDVMLGIGEAPVHPILSGVVLESGRDSLGNFVVIDHGNNIVSKMSGMRPVKAGDTSRVAAGAVLGVDSIVGRLAPKDSATFFLSVRRNGVFVRWKDFYSQSHPLDSAEIAKFVKDKGL